MKLKEIVKNSFAKVREDLSGFKQCVDEWFAFLNSRQRELEVKIKELEKKVKALEGDRWMRI